MKTTKISKKKKGIRATYLIIAFLSCVRLYSQLNALQDYKLGISAGSQISGNGHGTMLEGNINLANQKNIFSIGALVQKRKSQFSGISLSYSKLILDNSSGYSFEDGNDGTVQLLFYTKFQYINNTHLSYKSEKREERCYLNTNDKIIDFQNYKTSTLDLSAGFGLNLRICQNLIWTNTIGMGMFNHLNHLTGMYGNKTGQTLTLGTSLRLISFK